MCWPTRAENSATDSEQSGEMSASVAISQPAANSIASRRPRVLSGAARSIRQPAV